MPTNGNLGHGAPTPPGRIDVLSVQEAQKRRAAAAAQADARGGLLITIFLVFAAALTAFTLHREEQLRVYDLPNMPAQHMR